MKINELSPNQGATKSRKRIGRGPGSGWGKTSAKGHKGQKSRSGASIPAWFEGGQMPLQRRLPKRGFKNPFRTVYVVVNTGQLNDRFDDGATIDEGALVQAGLVKKLLDGIKLLADGDISKKFEIKVTKASKSAVAKVEAAGGTVEVQ